MLDLSWQCNGNPTFYGVYVATHVTSGLYLGSGFIANTATESPLKFASGSFVQLAFTVISILAPMQVLISLDDEDVASKTNQTDNAT